MLSLVTRYHTERVSYFTAELVTVYAYRSLARLCTRYLHLGDRVYVECHLSRGRFVADSIIMLARRSRYLDAPRQFGKVVR